MYDNEDDEDERGASDIMDRVTKKPRLLDDRCETCIFHPGNRMHLQRGRVKSMVRDALAGGGYITCHSTLTGPQNPTRVQAAVCRGFFDGYGHLSNVLRIFERLGGFTEVSPPCKGKG